MVTYGTCANSQKTIDDIPKKKAKYCRRLYTHSPNTW